MAHNWRGNVRELRNFAERHVLGLGGKLDGDGLKRRPLPEQMDTVEAAFIQAALAESRGNVQAAADALGVPRRTLSEKMQRLDSHGNPSSKRVRRQLALRRAVGQRCIVDQTLSGSWDACNRRISAGPLGLSGGLPLGHSGSFEKSSSKQSDAALWVDRRVASPLQ